MTRLFLDSGAFTFYRQESDLDAFVRTKGFWRYVDHYADYVKEHLDEIDYYANVDLIMRPDLSWEVLKYLEQEHKLSPVPVVHCGAPSKWMQRHIDAGYKYIGLGGLVGQRDKSHHWITKMFHMVCDARGMPTIKYHGFGVTSYKQLIRYPWFSVDSTTWAKAAGFGEIWIPHKRHGKFIFDEKPYRIPASLESPRLRHRFHIQNMSKIEQAIIHEWLAYIDVPLGLMKGDKEVIRGVCTHAEPRRLANIRFLYELGKWLPKWPWSFAPRRREGFDS